MSWRYKKGETEERFKWCLLAAALPLTLLLTYCVRHAS